MQSRCTEEKFVSVQSLVEVLFAWHCPKGHMSFNLESKRLSFLPPFVPEVDCHFRPSLAQHKKFTPKKKKTHRV